jgi:hypothetical protein
MALRELPDGHSALRTAAASCALAGRDEEAKRLVARLLEIDPVLRITACFAAEPRKFGAALMAVVHGPASTSLVDAA